MRSRGTLRARPMIFVLAVLTLLAITGDVVVANGEVTETEYSTSLEEATGISIMGG